MRTGEGTRSQQPGESDGDGDDRQSGEYDSEYESEYYESSSSERGRDLGTPQPQAQPPLNTLEAGRHRRHSATTGPGVHFCGAMHGLLVHGDGIYPLRGGLRAAGGEWNAILHGWMFEAGPLSRYPTLGAVEAMLTKRFGATRRERARSFVLEGMTALPPPQQQPQQTPASPPSRGSSQPSSVVGSEHEAVSSTLVGGVGEELAEGAVLVALYDWEGEASEGQGQLRVGARYAVTSGAAMVLATGWVGVAPVLSLGAAGTAGSEDGAAPLHRHGFVPRNFCGVEGGRSPSIADSESYYEYESEGGDGDDAAATSSSAAADGCETEGHGDTVHVQWYRDAMAKIYKQHNPRKLADIDGLLVEWAGDEAELLANIHTKYGIEDGPIKL
eukprot:COSAG01_NODE_1205_length_11235_cov_324.494124_9_plen_386_part_00